MCFRVWSKLLSDEKWKCVHHPLVSFVGLNCIKNVTVFHQTTSVSIKSGFFYCLVFAFFFFLCFSKMWFIFWHHHFGFYNNLHFFEVFYFHGRVLSVSLIFKWFEKRCPSYKTIEQILFLIALVIATIFIPPFLIWQFLVLK